MSNKKHIDVKSILNEEINTYNGPDDINFRTFNRNGEPGSNTFGGWSEIESNNPNTRPLVPHVLGPGDNPMLDPYGGQPYNETVARLTANKALMSAASDNMSKLRESRSLKRSEIGIEDTYFTIDSFYKEKISQPNEGLYVFDITRLNNMQPLKDIIEMEIGTFSIPTITTASYQPDYFKFRRLYVHFENIAGQQFIHGPLDTPLRASHFEMKLTTSTDLPSRLLADACRYSKYIFTMPIISISELRVKFRTPHHVVEFLEDVFDSRAVASLGPSPANRRITTNIAHGLTIGSSFDIYISDFKSTNLELNNFMNSQIGHVVEVINANTLQFTLAPAVAELLGTSVDINGGVPKFVVRIADRRIAFWIRFRSIVTKVTNYINP